MLTGNSWFPGLLCCFTYLFQEEAVTAKIGVFQDLVNQVQREASVLSKDPNATKRIESYSIKMKVCGGVTTTINKNRILWIE